MWALVWPTIEGFATLTGLAVGVKSLTANQATAQNTEATAKNTDLIKWAAYGFAALYFAKKSGFFK